MGSVCCVAARDRTIHHGPGNEGVHRNSRRSPSWSLRWDNRGRVAGEDTSVGWLSDGISRNEASEIKSATDVSAQASERESPRENHRMGVWRKGLMNDGDVWRIKTSASCQSIRTNISTEVKESTESLPASGPASLRLSTSAYSVPSVTTSPLSSQSHMLPPGSTPSRWMLSSPRNQLPTQVSDTLSSGRNSPIVNLNSEDRESSYVQPTGSDGSTRGSLGRSSDNWSLHVFSELMSSSHRERWSFGSGSYSFTHDKMNKSIGHSSQSVSLDLQTCGVCLKALTEKSAWSTQKIVANNELAVVAVLTCGHVYHAECLENITPEINKYDPACPVCTFGEKQVMRLSGKALRIEKEMKARNSKKSKNRVSTSDDDPLEFDYWKSSCACEGKDAKLSSSPSLKSSSSGKPFLRRHFSFGSKASKPSPDSHNTRRKGLFWAKSSKD